ncbi:MAG: D-alanine--D-alanine ligase [Acidobacteria bacterium]|nr:D-alanine--D-alanine ligase [Acidobacteriota bacterium]NIM62206.1 D-alanine--D-alanine ligase [Acidobacteriota bacterium]NIO58988.1 D-alanine--D-alanine ligase [Acidobacteriota bacterium]NIQ30034.1 D-alanine--D-alanine ligase [Acidobacteriota bacterium]NIQ84800.1 D-alanine--D-alanine ligase [Acidobacteriota bacterium]
MHEDLVPPETLDGVSEQEMTKWKTEYDVLVTLRDDLGHDVLALGLQDDLSVLRKAIEEFNPHIAFNLLEEFHGVSVYDHHVVSYLELMKRRYTGCNPRGLLLAHDKALAKQILTYHRVPVPDFAVFRLGQKVRRPKRLEFPLFVKSLTEEGSVGIAQASLVNDDEQLAERVRFVHESLSTDALAERFIDGRELYVGVIGNQRLQTFPAWELTSTKDDATPLIATAKVKWDVEYQKKAGIKYGRAKDLPEGIEPKLERLCKRAYRNLNLTGYARMDLRLTPDGKLYLLEANPNPQLSYGDEFAESAEVAGIEYPELLDRIIKLGLAYRAQWQVS